MRPQRITSVTSVYSRVTAPSVARGQAWSDGPIPSRTEEGQGHTRTTALEVTPLQLLEQGWVRGIGGGSHEMVPTGGVLFPFKGKAGMPADVTASPGALT